MSACSKQTFDNIDASAWDCLVRKAADFGIAITANSGQASKDGFTVAWTYDPTARTLELQCLDSPWWATCGLINGRIHEIVDGCR